MVFHIVGVKCGIHRNKLIVTELDHGLNYYGEKDMNPIHLIYLLEIKNIIRMNTNPWLNGKHWVYV